MAEPGVQPSTSAFFHRATTPTTAPDRFCLWHAPTAVPRAVVVYAPPFAEEMNKARRMASLQSQLFQAQGLAVLQMDLLGCGDSAGDFVDASWDAWVEDIVLACALARQRCAEQWPGKVAPPLWLWGLRSGCLLASAAAAKLSEPCNFLFWQPTPAGKTVLQQFLRLKLAGLADGADARAVGEHMRRALAANEAVEVAGYRLPAAVANGLEAATLQAPTLPTGPARLCWLEVSSRAEATLLPASLSAVQRWRDAGHEVTTQVVPGPAFWSTVEIEDAPALLQVSVDALFTPNGVRATAA